MNFRFSADQVLNIANEIVYVCETPLFDDLFDKKFVSKFEERVQAMMEDFRPELDVLVVYGDAMIFAMMLWHVATLWPDNNINVARYSAKKNEYVVRAIGEHFTQDA